MVTLKKGTRSHKRNANATTTPDKLDSPRRRYATLSPWLVIANGETPERGPLFTGNAYFDFTAGTRLAFERAVKSGFASLCSMAARLHTEEADWAKRCAQAGYGPPVRLMWETSLDEPYSELRLRLDGQLEINPVDPHATFVRALEGAELQRFRTCAVCHKFFYAIRSDQKACSSRCATALRVRKWRADQPKYEQNRKFKTAGVTPEGKVKR